MYRLVEESLGRAIFSTRVGCGDEMCGTTSEQSPREERRASDSSTLRRHSGPILGAFTQEDQLRCKQSPA